MNRTTTARRRRLAAVATGASLALVLAACGGDGDDGGGDDMEEGGAGAAEDIDCAAYDEFGDLEGTSVSVYTSIVEPEQTQQENSYDAFEECTGVTVDYEGSREFEAQLLVRIQAGNTPDIAYLPQPGLLNTIVSDFPDAIVEPPEATVANVDEFFSEEWKEYGSVDGTFYAAPLGANAKSFVWYNPAMFADAGYEVPETWTELMELTETIASEQEVLPWCAGVESGDATGWAGTDWIEDVVLRTAGPEVYDQWISHEIPFNDPQIVEAFDTAGEILKNPEYVNAGLGGVDSIATTAWDQAGVGVLDGSCWMYRMASFYATQWPEGTEVGSEGDVYAFYLPTDQTDMQPVLGGGEFVAAFDDRPEVQAFQTYLASADWANQKAIATPEGGWFSANNGLDVNNLASEFDRDAAALVADEETVFRFDASDLMPGEVGAGTFWNGIVDWLTGASSQEVTDQIESSWPM
ncbi:carbohydrate ABC transporter substrate-binding protein (CUT1 family) [Isoptericola sp. CG 20/1183]|uniref:Carbohydrate ABC transporter substrate-binding protein (CUT1 family) n=1 Tax=Isoptericola halotolerans TaxID=300560 RepID=A0ABX5EG46_9MICO|nr:MULTISPECIES: ABC transporter substrate-binding protein [Isoptericola]MCK0117250.1 ABC transporter substrate-binding protein [Isoptericola sp. S6320L]PRZ08473.1 carbohydrate ABC transporter substrate-binding protein (CUT1 family) [Isoptericola halotolerans]PRZ11080.1 carbohydrate ABC transporter substrate-binding protein (CUT1 family) [Isoptericola sp. CG 20/1183]